MAESFSNFPSSSLASAIDAVTTTLTVASASGFSTTATYRIRIENELLLVTAGAGTTTWTVNRGIEGTTAAAHAINSLVQQVLTASALLQLKADAIAAIQGNSPISVTSGVISIAAATPSVAGYMTTAQATQLANATTANTANTLVVRDGSGGVTATSLNATGLQSVTGGAPQYIVGASSTDGTILTYNPLSITVGKVNAQANSATISASTGANANQIALRDGNGYLFATYFNTSAGDFIGSQPYAIFGRNVSDGFIRTYNPAGITVGVATTATAANALNSGTADGDKLHGFVTSYGTIGAGAFPASWVKSYYTSTGRYNYYTAFAVSLPAAAEAVIASGTLPDGITYNSPAITVTGGGDGSPQRILLASRVVSGNNANLFSSNFEIVAYGAGGNLNTLSTNFRVNINVSY